MASKAALNDYYYLTKPGIIYGNLLPAAAGFLLACRWRINLELLAATLAGIGLVIGSACVFNNYIDRDIDRKMQRTKRRPLVLGTISHVNALAYATILGIVGFLILAAQTNLITVVLGLIGFFDYVVLYGISKRRFSQGTLIGSISGAIPPAAGYTAVTGRFDLTAFLLFLILVFWQMPHFYAISIYRYKDYKAAGLPVLPVATNIKLAKQRIIIYICLLLLVVTLLRLFGGAGYFYLIVALSLCVLWLRRGLKSYRHSDDQNWGQQMFRFSLVVIMGLSLAISLGGLLP
jgi:protoheme IX farnesyltransferase